MDPEQRDQAKRLSHYREGLAAQHAKNMATLQGMEVEAAKYGDPMMFPGLYSPSGFDMMSILVRVATRPNPTIPLGAIDSSCALVLCDLHAPDMPILYISDPFVLLTHYSSSEIIGKNCRFLQAPDGVVTAGQSRLYTDNNAVRELKQKVDPGSSSSQQAGGSVETQEVQVCLRNYKKGGEPFENLLTVVPIAWEEGGPLRYIVGFQVDKAKAFV